ncbi:hypothetical protein [Intestinimonas timonensis]|uniref:hypothetical protein n=1 Tax=Intestinimonas timonensis TaxID=1689270 RepID=UPI00102F3B5C|nr:hypothetical protein [Intestinimonas timonensis]
MDDELNEILSEEGAGLTTYRAIIRILVKMWQTVREEIRAATRAADRLRPVAAAAAVLAALSLAGCLYLGSVVHRQQGELDAIHRILEEGVVVEEISTTETVTTQTVEGDTATINNGSFEQYNDNAEKNGGGT